MINFLYSSKRVYYLFTFPIRVETDVIAIYFASATLTAAMTPAQNVDFARMCSNSSLFSFPSEQCYSFNHETDFVTSIFSAIQRLKTELFF